MHLQMSPTNDNSFLSIDDDDNNIEPTIETVYTDVQRPSTTRQRRCLRHVSDHDRYRYLARRVRASDEASIPAHWERRSDDTYYQFQPLLHLFMTVADPHFVSSRHNDRYTMRYLSRLIPIADGDSGLDQILHTTAIALERAERNRRRANRLYSRVLQDSSYPFRDLLSDAENDTTDDDTNPASNETN